MCSGNRNNHLLYGGISHFSSISRIKTGGSSSSSSSIAPHLGLPSLPQSVGNGWTEKKSDKSIRETRDTNLLKMPRN